MSHFFIPTENTATICMLGLIPVNVIGSVYCGEGLYASREIPGVAISEHYLKREYNIECCQPAFIGHAFQTIKSDDDAV